MPVFLSSLPLRSSSPVTPGAAQSKIILDAIYPSLSRDISPTEHALIMVFIPSPLRNRRALRHGQEIRDARTETRPYWTLARPFSYSYRRRRDTCNKGGVRPLRSLMAIVTPTHGNHTKCVPIFSRTAPLADPISTELPLQ